MTELDKEHIVSHKRSTTFSRVAKTSLRNPRFRISCNGRIGRLIAFKECLRHGVMPFIIDDKHRGRYLQGIQNWEHSPDVLTHVAREAQDRFESQIETQRLLAHGQNFLPANYKED